MLRSVIRGLTISSQPVARLTAPVEMAEEGVGRGPGVRPTISLAELSSISWTTLAEAEKGSEKQMQGWRGTMEAREVISEKSQELSRQ
jgi:hypothetical protein